MPDEISILDELIAERVAELFSAFGGTSRVRLISVLIAGERNVSSLADMLGISASAISHHLRSLRHLRIVKSRRDGKEVYYRIEDQHIISLFRQGVEHVQDQ